MSKILIDELTRLAAICPELNMSNYTSDDVDELNNWAIEVATAIDALAEQPAQPMHPEIKKMYEDYFDKCFRESSAAVPENFMDALRFDVAMREWAGLTDEEIIGVILPLVMADMPDDETDYEIARAIEAKLRSKNT